MPRQCVYIDDLSEVSSGFVVWRNTEYVDRFGVWLWHSTVATEDRYHWNTMVSDPCQDNEIPRGLGLMVDLDQGTQIHFGRNLEST